MLHERPRSRKASQRNPEREARFLYQNQRNAPGEAAPEGGATPNRGAPVDAGRNATATQARTVMHGESGSENKDLSPDAVHNNVQTTVTEMTDLHAMMSESNQDAERMLGEDPDLLKTWKSNERMLAVETPKMRQAENCTAAIANFAQGQMPFHTLFSALESNALHSRDGTRVLRDMKAETGAIVQGELQRISQEVGGRMMWDGCNAQTKAEIARAVMQGPQFQFFLLQMNTLASGWKQTLKDSKAREITEEIRKKTIEAANEGELQEYGSGFFQGIKNSLGIEVFTIGQMIGGFQKTWEAITTAWQRRNNIGEAKFARGLGAVAKMLPWVGDEVDDVLKDNMERSDEEEEKLHLNFLDRHNTGFEDVQTWIRANMHNHNRVRAGIQYAANNGWLYDMNGANGTAFGLRLESIKAANIKIEDYVEKLQRDNDKGVKEAMSIGESKASIHQSIPPIIAGIEQEMKDYHFYRIIGMMKVAIKNKGKTPEVSAWAAATVLRVLRDNPKLRKYMPTECLDQAGFLGLAPGTHEYLKFDRNAITEWCRGVKTDFKDAGTLAKYIDIIEQDIQRKSGKTLDSKSMTELVAKVLATHTVKLANGTVSIYDSQYDKYRENMGSPGQGGYVKNVNPGDTDPDFFGQQTEVILRDTNSYQTIYGTSSTGTLTYSDRALGLTGRIYDLADEFYNNWKAAQGTSGEAQALRRLTVFREEMRHKLDPSVKGILGHAQAQGSESYNAYTKNNQAEQFLAGLFRRGLVSLQLLRPATPYPRDSLRQHVLREMNTLNSRYGDPIEQRMRLNRQGGGEADATASQFQQAA